MTVFAFSFVNRILFLDQMMLTGAIAMSAIGIVCPAIAYLGYRDRLDEYVSDKGWPAIVFGLLLMSTSAVCAFSASIILSDLRSLNRGQSFELWDFIAVFSVSVGIGMIGLFISVFHRRS
jgi:hypothetical protein